jgi:hypothetical protein
MMLPSSILQAEAASNPGEVVLIDLEDPHRPSPVDQALIQAASVTMKRIAGGICSAGHTHDADLIPDS